jgi:3-phenylpropionate/trans-cinnamate dioxygenase ferredoxin subunit
MKEEMSRMNGFQRVCRVSEIPEGGRKVVEVGDRVIGLFRVQGQFWAIDDLCTHDGGPLAEGSLEGWAIVCPRHGARFDLRTGQALSMPATRPTTAHEVKVEGDDVFVKIREA